MKKYYSLAVACIALFLSSCQKEDLNGTITNSATSTDASFKAAATLNLASSTSVNYGALIGFPSAKNSTAFRLNVADQLGISCLRDRVLVPSTTICPLVKSKYQVLLNFNRGGYASGTPMKFFTDLTQYAKDLTSMLALYTTNKPAVAVIENEESNSLYYSGSAQEYINQLSTAVTVMHANGIKVTNGGIGTANGGLSYLIYQDFVRQGKTDSAQHFKDLTKVSLQYPPTIAKAAVVDSLLQAYTQMDLDYVNFHWKGTSPDAYALSCVINYLKKRTSKPVISNELGQFDTDPNTLLTMMQQCTNNQFPYVIWYSPDEKAGDKDMPLQHSTGQLTPNGVSYKNYILN